MLSIDFSVPVEMSMSAFLLHPLKSNILYVLFKFLAVKVEGE